MDSLKLDSVLEEIVHRLRAALNPSAIYLFGSAARGLMEPDSDVDLLVIVDDSPLTFFQRGALAYRALRRVGVAVDVQVYTRREFEDRAALPVSFERTVRSEGRLLYAA